MQLFRIAVQEMLFRRMSFLIGVASVAVAIGVLAGAMTMLEAHDVRTVQKLEEKEKALEKTVKDLNDELRKSMLKLGFNIIILPKAQNLGNFHADDFGVKTMPESNVEKLATAGVVTVRHFLPNLTQKVKWPERQRTIILVGSRGEVPNLHMSPKKEMVQPVPDGTMVLGYELQQSMGIKVGDKVKLMGREFTVNKSHPERGNKDDITAWIPLKDAQEMLGKEGQINSILALECVCALGNLPKIRRDIAAVLPDTQVLEVGEKALARLEARQGIADKAKEAVEAEALLRQNLKLDREKFSMVLTVVLLLACALWIGFLALSNVRERRYEIGVLSAQGFRAGQILILVLSRALCIGFLGGVVGYGLGFLGGCGTTLYLDEFTFAQIPWSALLHPIHAVLMIVLALVLTMMSAWIPALLATRIDPAAILREE